MHLCISRRQNEGGSQQESEAGGDKKVRNLRGSYYGHAWRLRRIFVLERM